MRCQICGAELKRPGDICKNCMNQLLEEKQYEKDDEVLYEVRKKFRGLFQSSFYIESAFIMILIFIGAIQLSMLYLYFAFLAVMIAIFLLSMFMKKKNIESYVYKFYRTKLVYEHNFLRKESKTIKYKDIKEITYSQTFWEKFCNLGQIEINTKTGNFLRNGIEIDCIENVEDVAKNIKQIVTM